MRRGLIARRLKLKGLGFDRSRNPQPGTSMPTTEACTSLNSSEHLYLKQCWVVAIRLRRSHGRHAREWLSLADPEQSPNESKPVTVCASITVTRIGPMGFIVSLAIHVPRISRYTVMVSVWSS